MAHDRVRSMVTCTDGACIDAAIILDATGFSRRLVEYEQPFEPGYQAAWGILAEVGVGGSSSGMTRIAQK